MVVLTSTEMQTLDRLTIEQFGLPGRLLMENAGREAVRVFLSHFGDAARHGADPCHSIHIRRWYPR